MSLQAFQRLAGIKLPSFIRRTKVTLVIDNAAVRLLTAEGNAVVRWASTPVASGLISDGIVQDPGALGDLVAKLFQQERTPKGNVVTCVPGSHAVYKSFTLPRMRRADLKNAVFYQAKRELPVPVEDLVMVWQLVAVRERYFEVFVTGVPKDIVMGYLETLGHAAIQPKALDVKPVAIARAVNRSNALLCNVEADNIDIVYIQDFVPIFVQTIRFQEPAGSTAVLAERLTEELHRSIRLHNETTPEQPVGANTPVFLSGGATDYFLLVQALYGSLGYTIEKLDPPLVCPADFPVEEYSANIGLALKAT